MTTKASQCLPHAVWSRPRLPKSCVALLISNNSLRIFSAPSSQVSGPMQLCSVPCDGSPPEQQWPGANVTIAGDEHRRRAAAQRLRQKVRQLWDFPTLPPPVCMEVNRCKQSGISSGKKRGAGGRVELVYTATVSRSIFNFNPEAASRKQSSLLAKVSNIQTDRADIGGGQSSPRSLTEQLAESGGQPFANFHGPCSPYFQGP